MRGKCLQTGVLPMSDHDRAVSILYPDDQPAGSVTAPDWHVAQRDAAAARLMGAGKPSGEGKDITATLYPDDQVARSDMPDSPHDDTAGKLYPEEDQPGGVFEEAAVSSFFSQHALTALQDGDRERADELQAASAVLVSDAKQHGSSAEDVGEALQLLNEATGDNLPPEAHEERRVAAMATLEAEMGVNLQTDLSKAQRFIQDLDKLIPGTIASLERTGAGNDVRLIKIAIKEARRRGY